MWHFVACIYWFIAVSEGFCTWYSADAAAHAAAFGGDGGSAAGDDDAVGDGYYDAFYAFGDKDQRRPNAFAECVNHWMPWEVRRGSR
jgi:hypothetical protein